MEFKKIVLDGYILGIGMVKSSGNITEQEYLQLQEILRNKIIAREGYDNKLKDDCYEWEEVDIFINDEVDDGTALEELTEIINNDE